MTSNLSEEVLAQIWDLADTHRSGKFTKAEFAIAMFLVQQKLQGRELPATLPPSLLSPVSAPSQQQKQHHQRAVSTSSSPAPPSSMNDLLSLGNALASPTQTSPTTSFPPSSSARPFVPTSHFGQAISKEKADGSIGSPSTSVPPPVVSRVASPPNNRLSTPPVASSVPSIASVSASASLPPVPAHSFGTASNYYSAPVAAAAPVAPAAPASRAISAVPAAAVGAAAGLAGSALVGAISSFGSHGHQTDSSLRDVDNQIKNVNGQVTSISNNNSQLSNQVDTISAQLAQSNEKLEYSQSELKRVSALKDTLQAKLASTQAEFETDSKKLSELQATLLQTQSEFDSLSANYTELQGSHESLKSQIVDAATKLEQEKQQNAELDEQIEDVQAELETLEEEFDTLDKDSRQQSGLLAINKKKFTALEAQKEELTAKLTELQTELETTKTQLVDVEGTHTTLNTETEELTSKVGAATAEIDQLKSQIEAANQEVESFKVEIENSKAKFTSLEEEKASLKEELVKLQADQEESKKEFASINEKTELLTSEIAKLQEEREVTKKKLIEEETAKAEAKAKVEKLEADKALAATPVTLSKEDISSIASTAGVSNLEAAPVSKAIDLESHKAVPAPVVSDKAETSNVQILNDATTEKPVAKSVDFDADKSVAKPADNEVEKPSFNSGSLPAGVGAGIVATAVAASAAVGSALFSKPDTNKEADQAESAEAHPAVEKIFSPVGETPDSTVIENDIPVDTESVEPITQIESLPSDANIGSSGIFDASTNTAPSESVSKESIPPVSDDSEFVAPDTSARSLIVEPSSTPNKDDLKVYDIGSSTSHDEKNSEILSSFSLHGTDSRNDAGLTSVVTDTLSKPSAELSTPIESVHSADSYDIIDKNEIPPISKFSESSFVDEPESVAEEHEPFTIPGSLPEPVIASENKFETVDKSASNGVSDNEDVESQYSDAVEPSEEVSSSKDKLNAQTVIGDSVTAGTLATAGLEASDSESSSVYSEKTNPEVSQKSVAESQPISQIPESEVGTPPIDVEKIPVSSIPGDVPTLAPTTEPVYLDFGEFTPAAAHSASTVSIDGSKTNVADLDYFKDVPAPAVGSFDQEGSVVEPFGTAISTNNEILSASDEFDKAFESLNNNSENVWPSASAGADGFDDFDKAFAAESGFSRADEEDEQFRGAAAVPYDQVSSFGHTAPFIQTGAVVDHNTGSDLSYTNTPVFAQAPAGQFPVTQLEPEAPQLPSTEAKSPFAPAQPAEMPSTHPFFSQRDFNDESLPAFLRNKKDIDPFDAAFDGLMAAEEEKDGDYGYSNAAPAYPFDGSASAFAPAASTLDPVHRDSNAQHSAVPASAVSNSEWDSIFAGFGGANTEATSANVDDAFSPAVPSLDKPFGGVLKHLEDEYSHLNKETQQQLESLTSMGFDKTRALEALEKNNFNIEDASNFLLDQ